MLNNLYIMVKHLLLKLINNQS